MTDGWPSPLTGVYIDGAWRPAADGRTYEVRNPATDGHLHDVAFAGPDDVAAAIAAAESGFDAWRRTSPWERSAGLRRVAALLRDWAVPFAALVCAEQGKTLREAQAEVAATIEQFDWQADEARRLPGTSLDGRSTTSRFLVRHEPVGVVAAMSSWNFPALLPARKLAAALAAGCAVIVKPAEEAPCSTNVLIAACDAAGIPAGAVASISGDPVAISNALVDAPIVRKVSVTGSVPVGSSVMARAAATLTEVTLELGGHAPVIVCADADLDSAIEACVAGKFRNAGQVCASPSRFYVASEVADEFVAGFVARASSLRVGDGSDPATDVGPLINAQRLAHAERLVDDAVECGAGVLTGGSRVAGDSPGYFFAPTVLADVPPEALVLRDEPFSPIAPVMPFDCVEDAIHDANASPFGLAGYVFTGGLKNAYMVAEGLEVGTVGVNTVAVASTEIPFGGRKASGFGRENGSEAILEFLVTKAITFELV